MSTTSVLNTSIQVDTTHIPDRIIWLVFYEYQGAFTFFGNWSGNDTSEQALKRLHVHFANELAQGAWLVSVKASDFKPETIDIVTLTSQSIDARSEILVGSDSGPMAVKLI